MKWKQQLDKGQTAIRRMMRRAAAEERRCLNIQCFAWSDIYFHTPPPSSLLYPKRVWWATPKQLEIQMFLLRWALSELQTGHTSRLKVLRLDGVIERTLTSCWPNQVQFSRGSKHSIDEWSGCREWCPIDVWSSTLKTNFLSVCLSVQYIPLLHHYPLVFYCPSLSICHWAFWPP